MANFLIVDDSPFVQKQLKIFLESIGHTVLALANDGNEGKALFDTHQPDLVTLDITMPNKNGKECLMEIIECDPNAKIIVISAIKDQEMVVDCIDLGAKAFINKPLKFNDPEYCEEFKDTLQEALE
jgi:two-component system chemotaxis response regulator CheY